MSTSSRDHRVPRKRVNVRERSARTPNSDYTPSPPPSRTAKAPDAPLLGHLGLILHHSLAMFSTGLWFLKIPIAVAGSVILTAYIYHYAVEVAIQTMCSIPGTSLLPMCKPITPKAHPLFEKVIKQQEAVTLMQKTASDNADLPYMLLVEQSIIKDLIFQISAADLPSKKILMPKVNLYNTLLEKVVDGIQDAQLMTDALVDNTISTYFWAEDQLEKIDGQKSSPLTPLRILATMVGFPLTRLPNEQTMQETFYGYTDRLQKHADAVIRQFQQTREDIVNFRDLLDTLALAFKEEDVVLETEKLHEAAYWKWLLRSHRQKLKGYDEKMELCAKFYRHLMDGGKIIEITLFKMQEMRGRVRGLRDELTKAPLQLQGEANPSLRLTINTIKSATAYLEDSRTISHKRRKERMNDFRNSLSLSQ